VSSDSADLLWADEQSGGSDNDGFTLVEMVVALIIMFGALIASSQVIINMVKATLYSRHADYAVTLATQVMENAVTNDCGGRLPDNRSNSRARWESQRDRCKFFATTPTYSTLTPTDLCKSRSLAGTTAYFKGWDAGSLDASRGESDLGRRYLVSEQGKVAYCLSYDVQWLPLSWSANAGTNNMRLQRTVRVQWVEPNRRDLIRERVYTQVAALPPDAVQTSNTGRVDVYVGLPATANDAPKSVTVEVPPVSTRAPGDPTALPMTLSADGNGWVHIPYIPTDVTSGSGAAVTVTPSFTVNVIIGGTTRTAIVSASSPGACWAFGSSGFVNTTPLTFTGTTCS
jgi:type II secretory pathway pseudopilin PulG